MIDLITEGIGNAAAICTTISFVPQLLRVWRRKSAEDISLFMFLLFSLGVALWLAYGIRMRAFPIIAANSVTLALALAILALKLKYDRQEKLAREQAAGSRYRRHSSRAE